MIPRLDRLWRSVVDVRPGEGGRTLFMALYLMLVLFAYYILKPVSRAMFLNKFDIDKLPWLYVLIAGVGGILAYFYTKLAVRSSLQRAVTVATFVTVGVLVAIWWLIGMNLAWMYYVFNIWVSLFSIILVSQGWLVAANVFNAREAKRLYGILGLGAVIGAAFGGSFTAMTVKYVGTRNLLFASAFMVILSWVAFRLAIAQKGVSLQGARAADEHEAKFSFGDIVGSVHRYRHLQVIIGIMILTYMVDVMVEFQFSATAKEQFRGDQLTAFLGSFYGLWLNLATFFLQFFLTRLVVSQFGVGGALQVMPVSIGLTSIATLVAPSVLSTGALRLTEAATRYSFNRTGTELLYLPLPADLKNRTKAFVDIFVDRLARGFGGMLLVFLTGVLAMETRHMSIVVMVLAALWIFLSVLAQREYVRTVRKRLDRRRLDLDEARVNFSDPSMVRVLEQTLQSPHPRQAAYALALLAGVPRYNLESALRTLGAHESPEVRARVYAIARERNDANLLGRALAEIRRARTGDQSEVLAPATAYAIAVSPEPDKLAGHLMDHPNATVALTAVEQLAEHPEQASDWITQDWLATTAVDSNPERRCLAAEAVRIRGDQGTEVLFRLLEDSDPGVLKAACRSAGALRNRAYLYLLIRHLSDSRIRGTAIDSLALFGSRIAGTLSDVIHDSSLPVPVRRAAPRVLRLIPEQRSVDVLLSSLDESDLTVRSAVLRSLNRLRESKPDLNYGGENLVQHILAEARYYTEMSAALAPFRESKNESHAAARLLASTLVDRLRNSVERLFRLLGLRYPQREIYSAYLALSRGGSEDLTAAMEFLDSVLERELKRVVMPLLEDFGEVARQGVPRPGIERKDVRSAIRELIHSGDSWLAACAVATAAELKLRDLSPVIAPLRENAGREVGEVAHAAVAALDMA